MNVCIIVYAHNMRRFMRKSENWPSNQGSDTEICMADSSSRRSEMLGGKATKGWRQASLMLGLHFVGEIL